MEMPQAGDEAPSSPRRIGSAAARKMLRMVGRNYSDSDMEAILNLLYGIAGEAFDRYLDAADCEVTDPRLEDPDLTE